ncbi:MAG: right-handed parallel beta-helix repeat-containing protein, partial [Candidatus Poribacteria bacterium]
CMGVHHSVCSDNVFTESAGNGIGGVANGGDHHNVISDNVCSYNGLCGIDANRGEEQVITGNLLLGNSRSEPGRWPGVRLHDMRHTLVQGNRCADDQDPPTQTAGIVESGESDVNLVSGNMCVGMRVGVETVGAGSRAEGNLV